MKTAPDPTRWFAVRDGLPVVAVGFAAVAVYRRQIEDNQGQTLEEISATGGLDWYELWAGFSGFPLFPSRPMSLAECRTIVLQIVQDASFNR